MRKLNFSILTLFFILVSVSFIKGFNISSHHLLSATDFRNNSVIAVNDTIKTEKSGKIRIKVTNNDTILCNNYSINILGSPMPSASGTAEIDTRDSDVIVFTPAVNFIGDVQINYQVTCSNFSSIATLFIQVVDYSTPVNAIPDNTACLDTMPIGVDFIPALKTSNSTYRLDGFTMPLVGDLNGDGKPEIIALGLDGSSGGSGLDAYGRYIVIYNGQDGTPILRFDLRSLGGTYGSSSQFKLRYQPRHNSPCHIAIADLDRDGLGEIVVCETGSNGRVYTLKPTINQTTGAITNLVKMWDGNDGGNLYSFKYPIAGANENYFGSAMPYISDLNGDGIPEVIVYNKIYNGVTGQILLEMEELKYFNKTDFNYLYTSADQAERSQYSYVGRRHGYTAEADDAIPVISIIDIDNDGIMEIVAGMKVYKPLISNTGGKSGNSVQIIEGASSINLPYGTGNGTRTYQLMDGYTLVADIDGDDHLDIIVQSNITQNWDDDYRGLIVVWDPRFPQDIKAASIFRGNSLTGMSSIPFIGDINGRLDDISGSKKLPEICITTGVFYYSKSYDNYVSGIPFHPLSTSTLEYNSSYFNKARGTGTAQCEGHIIGLTYHGDENTPIHERLKLSWAMEHEDRSANTGITMFDFDNDGIMELCYRDEKTVRLISPAMSTYIRKNIIDGPIRFRYTGIKSYTGYEAPVIADVNMDGSADIITFCYTESGTDRSYGFPFIFEHASGSDKWAPAPPVWNQGIYFPLQIKEDLTVPTSPISSLTKFININGETIQPYNGNWIQQPIVLEGEKYIPVVRKPDASLMYMVVDASSGSYTDIDLTIRNLGSASINAQTPIAFYKTENITDIENASIDNAELIEVTPVGVDIFKGDKITRTYRLNESYPDILIWARIVDDGTNFPVIGFDECNLSDNVTFGMDCPNLLVEIESFPTTNNICGDFGYVKLFITEETLATHSSEAEYQWFRDGNEITGANDYIYFADQAGEYTIFISDGIVCKKYSDEKIIITQSQEGGLALPQIDHPHGGNVICGPNGVVFLKLLNIDDYNNIENIEYQWYKNNIPIIGESNITLIAEQEGSYKLRIRNTENDCMTYSNTIDITENTNIGREETPMINANPTDAKIYDNNSVNLYLSNSEIFSTTQTNTSTFNYYWYNNISSLVDHDSNLSYDAYNIGRYNLLVKENNQYQCQYISNYIIVTEGECGDLNFEIRNFNVCAGEAFNLSQGIQGNINSNLSIIYFLDEELTHEINPVIPEGIHTSTTFYVISVEISTNCMSAPKELLITVKQKPTLIASELDYNNICPNEEVKITINFTGNSPWGITYNNGYEDITINNITQNPYNLTLNPSQTATYRITKVSNTDCFNELQNITRTVNVGNYPDFDGLTNGDYIWIGNKNSELDKTWSNSSNWRMFNGIEYTLPANVPDNNTNIHFIDSNSSCIYSKEVILDNNGSCNNINIENEFTLKLNNKTLNVYGDFLNNGFFDSESGKVIFSGNNEQKILTNGDYFFDLELNSTGTNNLTILDNLIIDNSANFIYGILKTNENKVIFKENAITNIGSSNSFVDGTIEKIGGAEFIFPTGNVANRNIDGTIKTYKIWAPFKAKSFSNKNISVKYIFDNENLPVWWYHDSSHEHPLTHVSDREYWLVESLDEIIYTTLYWRDNNPCSIHDFCERSTGIFYSQYLTTAFWNGLKWIDAGGIIDGDETNGNIATTYGPIPMDAENNQRYITFGATSKLVPLPIEIINYNTSCNNNNVTINWTTLQEINTDYFVIERSADMINFSEIYRIKAAGYSGENIIYSHIDESIPEGNLYYRLIKIDMDGEKTYYNILKANCNNGQTIITVFPNPTDSEITIILENFDDKDVYFEIYNDLGQLVIFEKYTIENESSDMITIDLSNLSPALYYLRTKSKKHSFNNRVILQTKNKNN